MSTAEVATLLHHPEPSSRLAAEKVGRLVKRGLPTIPGLRPRVFIREDVIAWFKAQSGPAEDSDPLALSAPRRRRRHRKQSPATLKSPLEMRLAQMRREAG